MRKHLTITSYKTLGSNLAAAQAWGFAVVVLLSCFPFTTLSSQCTISCSGYHTIALDQNGSATVSADILLADPDCDPNDFTVNVIWNGQNIGNALNCIHIGTPLEAQVINNFTGNYCSSMVEVMDYMAPQISCIDTIVPCNSSLSPLETGYPDAIDNCTVFSNTDFAYSDEYIDLPCTTIQNGITVTARVERKWWVMDAAGLTDTCVQMIYLERAAVTEIIFPLNLDGFQSPFLDCSQDPEQLSLTGEPTIFGQTIINDDACELSVTFADLVVETCGENSYNIIRTWTAADWCTGAIINHAQIIKVKDTTAPQISCPTDITVSASPISCGAAVLLPTATATDDCSAFIVNSSWEFGTGNGPFYGVPVGAHEVTYTAEDDCGNTSTCTISVTVVDDIAPVNICKTSLSINISSGGSATVPAVTFDDGSFDNCQIAYYEAKRSGMPFGAFVTFDCSDVNNGPVAVTFRIFDTSGNYNDCVASVTIHDNIYPLISCPSTTYLNCGDDFYNTAITGVPTVVDNCGIDTLYFEDVSNLSDCGIGTIARTWTVVDVSGHATSCVQTLVVEDATPVQVTFPADYSSSVCGLAQTDPSITGEPTIINDDCESVDFTFTENIFAIAAPACYTILRNWVVVDWCTYVPNSGSSAGYYTHTQVITITDNEAPVLEVPASFTGFNLSNTCGSDYIVIDSATATDCNPNVVFTNDSPYAISSGADASGNYPIGVHNITFTASDGCGNVTTGVMTLSVEDGLSPTVYCIANTAVNLNTDGEANIDPTQLVVSVADNCTSENNLIITASPTSFDCMDIGLQTVTLTVKDEAGNTSTCTTIVEVQDNQFACGQSFELSGQVLSYQGVDMGGMDVQFISGDTSTAITNADGTFSYAQGMANNSYQVRPYKNTNFGNGVSSWDLVLISKHILGTQKLNDPFKIIAADVNRSGSVSTFDLVHLKKIILNVDTAFANNTSWRFIDANHVFANSENPFSSLFPETRFIETLAGDVAGLDFMGVKVGDVNGNANVNGLLGADGREEENELVFEMEEKAFTEEEAVEIVFQARTSVDLMAYQFTIELDTNLLSFIEIIPSIDLQGSRVGADDFGLSYLEQGLITAQWINTQNEKLKEETEFFRIKCTAKMAGLLSDAITIHSDLTEAIAYRENESEGVEKLRVVNHFDIKNNSIGKENLISLKNKLSNYPNPFKIQTTLVVESLYEGMAIIHLVDQKGVICMQKKLLLNKGRNEMKINRSELPNSRVYFCQVTLVGTGVKLSHKLLVVD